MDITQPITDLVSVLTSAEGAAHLVGAAFDFAVRQPIETLVERDKVIGHVKLALTEANISGVIDAVVRGFVDREFARSKTRDDLLGDWLPEDATGTLHEVAGRPVVIDQAFVRRTLEEPAVRAGIRGMVRETLDAFVQSLANKSVLGGLGKGLFGGLGGQLQKQLSRAAARFVDGSLNLVLKRMVTGLGRKSTQQQIGRMAQGFFDHALTMKTREIWSVAKKAPVDDVLNTVPSILLHNIAREAVQTAILEEVDAVLARLGDQSLNDLLDPTAIAAWRVEVVALVAPLVSSFCEASLAELIDLL